MDFIALFDFDSHIYHSVYRIVSISDIKALLNVERESMSFPERKQRAFEYIVEEAYSRMQEKTLKIYNAIEELNKNASPEYHINLMSFEYYITYCKNSIRKNISSHYKSNRKPNKYVSALRSKLIEESTVIFHDEYEADDLIADRAKELREQGVNYLIISIDKDLKQIPGYHYSYYTDKFKDEDGNEYTKMRGLHFTNDFESYKMLAFQVIAGDSGDRVKGVPGLGIKKTNAILQNCKTRKDFLNTVVRTYIKYEWDVKAKKEKYPEKNIPDFDWREELFMNFRLVYLGRS